VHVALVDAALVDVVLAVELAATSILTPPRRATAPDSLRGSCRVIVISAGIPLTKP
jgi:hypothetical protein